MTRLQTIVQYVIIYGAIINTYGVIINTANFTLALQKSQQKSPFISLPQIIVDKLR